MPDQGPPDAGRPTFRQNEVEQTLLGEEPTYTRDQVAELANVDLERAQQLWIAMGFPVSPDPDAVMFTDADIEALRLLTTLVDENVVEKSMEVAVARTLGQSMSRLAEWQVGVVNSYIRSRIAADAADPDAIRSEGPGSPPRTRCPPWRNCRTTCGGAISPRWPGAHCPSSRAGRPTRCSRSASRTWSATPRSPVDSMSPS
ncbi:adenylate cyclase regulatory domain-containing protein [Rhodococcus sp. SORGH_AS_0303]|uniref:adenylate cyclase regulatory domain-containing protein n=1 Tax=Rhodococcus sp. SORGH_AS_0303 TaxID=3041753 RepID=UPI0027D8FEE1|nr:adenylate cyclase regulatory domain-containing protein [Rhodococcus sp. SORGH_AS_0303]